MKTCQTGREEAMQPLIDRLVVLHIYRKEHDTDPALALKDILDWEIQTALDPQVSSGAQALIDRGRKAMRIECLQECSAEATDNGTAQRIAKAIEEIK